MLMDKETVRCVSIAERPGTFGVEFHNRGYELLGLNYLYIPLKVMPSELKGAVNLVRNNFRGCSVSMPHKIKVMAFLDGLDDSAAKVGAVNTVVNEKGRLIGYNTDYYGARKSIVEGVSIDGRDVLMIGAGGVARAIGNAVKDLGGKLIISNRTDKKTEALAETLGASVRLYSSLASASGYLLINATRVGMDNPKDMIISGGIMSRFDAVMDVVVPSKGETSLVREAKAQGKMAIPGVVMTTYQAAEQFKLYTGRELPEDFLENFIIK